MFFRVPADCNPDMETDIENLKRKIEAGADIVKTQLFV